MAQTQNSVEKILMLQNETNKIVFYITNTRLKAEGIGAPAACGFMLNNSIQSMHLEIYSTSQTHEVCEKLIWSH